MAPLGGLCDNPPGTDLRGNTMCTFTVTPGVGSFDIPMEPTIPVCNCTAWGAILETLAGGAYTYTCTGAAYYTPTAAPEASRDPIRPECNFLEDFNPVTRCSTAPTGWCTEGDFWKAANYTVVNDVTEPWDGTNVDASVSANIIAALNAIFANATTYNHSTCLCTDTRMAGWTPHLVMVANTEAPTASGISTLPPTISYTSAPTTFPPTTPAPSTLPPSAAPTTPTPAPTATPSVSTTLPPTPGAVPFPIVPEMCTESEPYAAWRLCTFDPEGGGGGGGTFFGSVACNATVYASTCNQPSTCPDFLHAGLGNNMCGSSPTSPYRYLSYPVQTPGASPGLDYPDCILTQHGVGAACVAGSGSVGYPTMYYCQSPDGATATSCTGNYPCTEPHEIFFGDVNKTTSACYIGTLAPVAPPPSPTYPPVPAVTTTPPSTSPTSAPTPVPSAVPTVYYPLVNNPDNTVREFWPENDAQLRYAWQYVSLRFSHFPLCVVLFLPSTFCRPPVPFF